MRANPKRYVVKKYVMARSAQEALKLESKVRPDDVWLDEKQPSEPTPTADAIGFHIPSEN